MLEQTFDYTAWQLRLRFNNSQAAHALGISDAFYAKLKRDGNGRKTYAWAAYGIEMADTQAKKAAEYNNPLLVVCGIEE